MSLNLSEKKSNASGEQVEITFNLSDSNVKTVYF